MTNFYKYLQNAFLSLSFDDQVFDDDSCSYNENKWVNVVKETREQLISLKNIDSIRICSDFLIQFFNEINIIPLIETEIPEILCCWVIDFTNTYIIPNKNNYLLLNEYLNNLNLSSAITILSSCFLKKNIFNFNIVSEEFIRCAFLIAEISGNNVSLLSIIMLSFFADLHDNLIKVENTFGYLIRMKKLIKNPRSNDILIYSIYALKPIFKCNEQIFDRQLLIDFLFQLQKVKRMKETEAPILECCYFYLKRTPNIIQHLVKIGLVDLVIHGISVNLSEKETIIRYRSKCILLILFNSDYQEYLDFALIKNLMGCLWQLFINPKIGCDISYSAEILFAFLKKYWNPNEVIKQHNFINAISTAFLKSNFPSKVSLVRILSFIISNCDSDILKQIADKNCFNYILEMLPILPNPLIKDALLSFQRAVSISPELISQIPSDLISDTFDSFEESENLLEFHDILNNIFTFNQ